MLLTFAEQFQEVQTRTKYFEKEAEDAKRELALLQAGSTVKGGKGDQTESKLRETQVLDQLTFMTIKKISLHRPHCITPSAFHLRYQRCAHIKAKLQDVESKYSETCRKVHDECRA